MSDAQARARYYTRLGLRVIPVSPETKRPRVKGFDDLTYTAYRRVKPDDMVAILCGPCPALGDDYLCCLDRDGGLTREALGEALGVELPDTLTTHDGAHDWYRVEPGPHRDALRQWSGILGLRKSWAGPGKAPDADVRWCGGYAREHQEPPEAFDVDAIAVLPAAAVEAIVARRPAPTDRDSDPLGPVRDLDGDAIERLVAALVEAWPAEGEGRHDSFLALGGMLRRQGVSLRSAKAVAKAIVEGTGSDRSRVKDTTAAWLRTEQGLPAYGWTELSQHLHADATAMLEVIDEATSDPWMTRLLAQGWPPRPPEPVAEPSAAATGSSAADALAALSEWQRDHVLAAQEELRTPLDLNLINAIGTTACALSGRIKVRIHDNYTCHTCLFVCSVADPGQLKSPAFRLATAPIKAWVEEQQDAGKETLQRKLMARADLEMRKAALEKVRKQQWGEFADAPEDADLLKVRIALEAPEPKAFEFLVQDATPEALTELLATHGRLACMSSDASKVFSILGGHYSQGQADLGVWLEAYDGEMKEVHRKGKPSIKPQHELKQTTLSALLSIQPSVLESVTGNAAMVGQGLVQRMCWVVCASTGARWRKGEVPASVPPAVAETWDAGIRFLLDLPAQEVRLSAEAFAVYIDYRDEIEARRTNSDGDLRGELDGWASKHLERTVRIAAGLWACDGAEGREITGAQMARAVTIGQWLVPHARAALQGGDVSSDEAAVLRWVERIATASGSRTAWVTSRDLSRQLTPKRLRRDTKRVLRPLLDDLVNRGALEATADAHPKYRLPR